MPGTIRVLLVEDDDGDARRVEILLKRTNEVTFEVTRSVSLLAGLTVLEAKHHDVALLDLSLPDFQGYDTAVEFVRRSSVPFLVLTGNDDVQMAMRCVSLGAQDYVLKNTVSTSNLTRAILMALKRVAMKESSRALDAESVQMMMGVVDSGVPDLGRLVASASCLLDALEDLDAFILANAPNLRGDVEALLAKYGVRDSANIVRRVRREGLQTSALRGRKSISEVAIRTVDSLVEKRGDDRQSLMVAQDADHDILDIITRREREHD